MATKSIFVAMVADDLTLKFLNPARIKQYLLPLKGERVEVTAEKQRRHRTDAQARYYRGVVLKIIGDYCGYRSAEELEELHQEMKRRFLPKRGVLSLPVSTTTLNAAEMGDYIETVRDWAARDLGLYVPEANEITE